MNVQNRNPVTTHRRFLIGLIAIALTSMCACRPFRSKWELCYDNCPQGETPSTAAPAGPTPPASAPATSTPTAPAANSGGGS